MLKEERKWNYIKCSIKTRKGEGGRRKRGRGKEKKEQRISTTNKTFQT